MRDEEVRIGAFENCDLIGSRIKGLYDRDKIADERWTEQINGRRVYSHDYYLAINADIECLEIISHVSLQGMLTRKRYDAPTFKLLMQVGGTHE
jgi:hypothetical protein